MVVVVLGLAEPVALDETNAFNEADETVAMIELAGLNEILENDELDNDKLDEFDNEEVKRRRSALMQLWWLHLYRERLPVRVDVRGSRCS